MTAIQVLAEVRAAHGRLIPEGGNLRYEMPVQPSPGLLERLRERKHDLLMLLAKPTGSCPAGHPPGYWQDSVGQFHCMDCEPNPAWRRLRGVTLEALGNRAIVLRAPTGDLGEPGSWVRAPGGGAAEVVLYREDGGEVLVRTLRGERLAWHRPEELLWKIDWGWSA